MPTVEQLQAEIDHLEDELLRQGKKLNERIEILKKSILRSEHEKIVAKLKLDYEHEIKKLINEYDGKLSNINNRHISKHNERNAGRKKKVTDEIEARILQLHNEKYSQIKIVEIISDEFHISISRTSVGDIIRNASRISVK